MSVLTRKVPSLAQATMLALLIALGFAGTARAGSYAGFSFTGTGSNTGTACWLNYTVTLAGYSGWYAFVGVDSIGQPLDVDYFYDADGSGSYPGFLDISGAGAINTAAAGPVTGKVYHHGITAPPAGHQASPDTAASYAYAIGAPAVLHAQASIDPTPILGSCGPASDGRINPEPGATVAIYCNPDGGFDIYGIDRTTGQGFLAIRMTAADIAAVPDHPSVNMLVREFGDIRLYRLTTGEWQVNRGPDFEGKTYVYIWRECNPGSGHEASFTLNNPPPPPPLIVLNQVMAALTQVLQRALAQVSLAR